MSPSRNGEAISDHQNFGVNRFSPRDVLHLMTSWDAKKDISVLAHEGYTYDAMNRITLVSYSPGIDSFGYYLDGELNTATLGNLAHTLAYNLDKNGNRTSVVDNNVSSTYLPNTINQYYPTAAGSSISNGSEHEITTYGGVTYTYINDERLESAAAGTTYSMVYDALGRCVKRSLSGGPMTYYIYDGEKPILEYDSGGTLVGTNVYGKGIDEILLRIAVGSAYYPQQNHEGSVTLLTDGSGNVLERYRYDAFGAPTVYTASWGTRSATIYDNRFLFTGREYAATYRATTTAAFNFYEYRARAYNPKLGRFMSEDPKVFDAGDYNLFRYCHNDPLDMTDPMGLDWLSSTSDFFAGAGDTLTLGATAYIRGSLPGIYGPGGGVNQTSTSYRAGEGTGLVLGMATGEGEAAGGRSLAKLGAKATGEIRNARELAAARRAKEAGQKYEEILKAQEKARKAGRAEDIRSTEKSRQRDRQEIQEEGKRALEEQRKARESQRPPTDFKPAIDKAAQEHSSDVIHSKPDPNPQ
ncbi:MAG TPA: RHS repeat-associated core domain-containing protein [Candidatus Udaeobacter sp.]